MLTNEAIEVHLGYLRSAVEAMQAELTELRKEIKILDEKLAGKVDPSDEQLDKAMASQIRFFWQTRIITALVAAAWIAHIFDRL